VTVSNDIAEEYDAHMLMTLKCASLIANPAGTDYEVKNGLLYTHDGRLRIPNDMSIKSLLLYESHDTDVSGHTGMIRLLNYSVVSSIGHTYIAMCRSMCPRALHVKATRRIINDQSDYYNRCQYRRRRWEVVTMDLITRLPVTRTGHMMLLSSRR